MVAFSKPLVFSISRVAALNARRGSLGFLEVRDLPHIKVSDKLVATNHFLAFLGYPDILTISDLEGIQQRGEQTYDPGSLLANQPGSHSSRNCLGCQGELQREEKKNTGFSFQRGGWWHSGSATGKKNNQNIAMRNGSKWLFREKSQNSRLIFSQLYGWYLDVIIWYILSKNLGISFNQSLQPAAA